MPTRREFLSIAGASLASAGIGGSLLGSGLAEPAWAATRFGPVKEEDAVISFGHVGPVSDEGWTWTHHQGLLAVKAAFPKAKYIEVESIPYSADATRTFRQFVADKSTIVFITSEYGDLLAEVTKRAPDIAFLECNGHRVDDNVSWYYIQHWMPTYVIGVAAGLLSKSGKLGYVGSFPVPSVYCGASAFQMGARSVNPKATTQVILINSWFDPQAAHQAGTALIDGGADFLFGIMDESAYLQVAEQRKVWAAMDNTDMRRYGPDSYVSSVLFDWRKLYVSQVKARLDGTWKPRQEILLPMGDGTDRDAWGAKVPEAVQKQADAVRDKMLKGWTPFVGEIKDTDGKVRVKAGETMGLMDLYNWSWPVEGVTGLKAA